MKNDYLNYKIKLIKSTNGEGASILSIIKNRFGYLQYDDAIHSILKNPHFKDYFVVELFPKNINDIITYDYIPLSLNKYSNEKSQIANEITCFIALFHNFENKLHFFAQQRDIYEYNLFSGNYKLAENALINIEEQLGNSFWLIESKLLLNNYTMNVIEAKNYYQKLKEKCSDDYIKIFIRALRRKTNIFESPKDSYSFIEKKLRDFNNGNPRVESYKSAFFDYYNHQIASIKDNMFYPLLYMASHLNITDMFLLIEKLIINFICGNSLMSKEKEKIISVLYNYDLPFIFKKSCKMLHSDIDVHDNLTKSIYQLKSYLSCGVNKESMEKGLLLINSFPFCFDIILNFAKMEIICSSNYIFKSDLLNCLINTIKASIKKDGDYDTFNKVYNNANRLLMLLNSTTLNYGFSNFFNDSFNGEAVQQFIAVFTSNYYNRYLFYYFKKEEHIDSFNSLFGKFESNWYHNIIYSNKVTYDPLSIKLFYNEYTLLDLETLHRKIETQCDAVSIVLDNRYCEKLFQLYLETGKIKKAIGLYVDQQFKSKLKVCSFNIDLLSQKCNGIILPALYADLNFCIYAHLTNFRGAVGLRYNNQSANSLMAIININHVALPSQLVVDPNLSKLDKAKYAYLFRHICNTDLLTSKFVGNGINIEDLIEQTKAVLKERITLLYKAKSLDIESERIQIDSQIKTIENKINSLGHISLEDTIISYAKIIESSINVSDVDIILPFYNGQQEIINQSEEYRYNDCSTGEFLIFRDLFVKYKKAYIKCLDQQIGINIRHGFLKNEILTFFLNFNISFDKFPSKIEEQQKSKDLMISKLNMNIDTKFLTSYVPIIADFSKKLYCFIDDLLDETCVKHSSSYSTNSNDIFIDDRIILDIANNLSDIKDPYDFKNKLNFFMGEVIDTHLKKLGIYITDIIYEKCSNLLDECFHTYSERDPQLNILISEIKSNIPQLCERIQKWFEFIKDSNRLCSIGKYFSLLQEKYSFISYSLSDNLPDEINFYQLHCLDLILSNLIMNAEEHSNLNRGELIINTSLTIQDNIMKIYFNNNLSKNIEKKDILLKIKKLEYNLKCTTQNNSTKKGNGFYHIAESLNSLNGMQWNLSFCKEELPEYFALKIEIDWSDYIVQHSSD